MKGRILVSPLRSLQPSREGRERRRGKEREKEREEEAKGWGIGG